MIMSWMMFINDFGFLKFVNLIIFLSDSPLNQEPAYFHKIHWFEKAFHFISNGWAPSNCK